MRGRHSMQSSQTAVLQHPKLEAASALLWILETVSEAQLRGVSSLRGCGRKRGWRRKRSDDWGYGAPRRRGDTEGERVSGFWFLVGDLCGLWVLCGEWLRIADCGGVGKW